MFPSSGLFADINCPFLKGGLCERPHCLYQHATEVRDMSGALYKPSVVDFAGVHNRYPSAVCGVPVIDETKDDCLQELERINKEIETVKHEVEQEQRRLSHYQTVEADTTPKLFVSKSDPAGKNGNKASYGMTSSTDCAKTCSRLRKYVVDNSKPRTDLEYDPMSNFSADFRSYKSSIKEEEKNGQDLKRDRNADQSDAKKTIKHQSHLTRSSFQETLEDSYDDAILIIDIPPSPDRKRGQAQKTGDCVLDVPQDVVKELQETKEANTILDYPPIRSTNAGVFKVTSPPTPTVEANIVSSRCVSEDNQVSSKPYQSKDGGILTSDGSVIDLTESLEVPGRESQKVTCFQLTETGVLRSPAPSSSPEATDQQDHSWHNLVMEEEENTFSDELPQTELPFGVEKQSNPLQPHHFPHKNVLPKSSAASSCSPYNYIKQTQNTEQTAQNTVRKQQSPKQSDQKAVSEMVGQTPDKTASSSDGYLEQAEPASGSSQHPTWHIASVSENYDSTTTEQSTSATEQLLFKAENGDVIIIDSSSDEEEEGCNYSEVELSDSDPMEECYRIFMEANEEGGNEEQPDVPVEPMDTEKSEADVKPQGLPGKKRKAHEAKHTEQPVFKSRPQPQVLVPLREPATPSFTSHLSTAPKIQQVQQRASMLTASMKGGQAFVSNCQRKQDPQTAAVLPIQASAKAQPAPVQNGYLNFIPLGSAVVEMGNNLHLIFPQGTFPLPVTSSSNPVTSVLTPISQVPMSPVTVKQAYPPSALMTVHRYRTTAPMLIPAPARKPSFTSASVSTYSSPANPSTPQGAAYAATKPAPTKRKVKQLCEAAKDKVPHDIRQRYVNMFTEEILKSTASVDDAFEKALAEEKTVYNRSMNKLKYLSVAVNALKRLKNQNAVAAKDENTVNSQRSKGNIPLNQKKLKGNDDIALYESLKDYILTEDKLIESNYPVQHPEKPSCAVLFVDNKKGITDALKRICCRCGATYSVSQTGKHIRKEECNYHYGKGVENRVPGGVETRYSCCQGVMGAPGCQLFKLHVHDSLSLEGFVATVPRHPTDSSCPGVFSVDCEMCYTIHGLEISRVTVINSNLQVVYDTFVRPDNEVIDYNTRFSGISEEDVKGTRTSLIQVQETLLSFISADTILIGHGLETGLCALKLLHGMVVDTSMVFPHRLGPPHKLTLNSLTAEYLRRIIQESVCGHDTAEDAAACMELMLLKVKDGKLKK